MIALVGTVMCTVGVAHADALDPLVDLYLAKKYSEVLPPLYAYRSGPMGRVWRVDFMIGISECYGPQHVPRAVWYLNNVLAYKDSPDDAVSLAQRNIQYCSNLATLAATAAPGATLAAAAGSAGGQFVSGPSVVGKGGFNFIPDNAAVTTARPKPIPVSVDDLRARVFAPNRGADALAAAVKLMGPGSKGIVDNGFVVVCSRNCIDQVSHDVSQCLVRYWQPLEKRFAMRRPESLVTVYVPAEISEVPEYSRKLHGVDLPLGTIAYSVREDVSIVGLMSEGSCGSLAHELVHLTIKGDFGDSPVWLEEGLASEVAVARPQADGFKFERSWRDNMLSSHLSLRPTVAELLKLTWTDFATMDRASLDKVIAVHAMAAVFVRYLDARGKLDAVYAGIRDGRDPADGREPRTNLEVVEQVLGKSAAEIDADFLAWFRA